MWLCGAGRSCYLASRRTSQWRRPERHLHALVSVKVGCVSRPEGCAVAGHGQRRQGQHPLDQGERGGWPCQRRRPGAIGPRQHRKGGALQHIGQCERQRQQIQAARRPGTVGTATSLAQRRPFAVLGPPDRAADGALSHPCRTMACEGSEEVAPCPSELEHRRDWGVSGHWHPVGRPAC